VVVKKHILKTVNKLDRLYNTTPTAEATYYSKLAIIELCGWIEQSMDMIADSFANRKLKTLPYQSIYKSIKEKNYGFVYKEHFRKMLYQTIGLHQMESLEKKLNHTGSITVFQSELETLKILRNDAAHTYIDATKTYQAPSVTKAQLETIYPILRQIHKEIRKL
jgi:hypothetical protein